MLHIHRQKTHTSAYRTDKLIPIFIFIACFLFAGHFALAQPKEMNLYDHDNKSYYFGITLGVNAPRFHAQMHPKFLQNDSVFTGEPINSYGFSLGLLATGRLSNRLQVRFNPQLQFYDRNIVYNLKYPDGGESKVKKTVESVAVTFPVQVKFQSDRINNFRVYMLAGFRADIDLASNARAKKAEDLIKIKKYDYGPEVGIGFNFFFQSFILSPEIKFTKGIPNIHSRDPNLNYSNVFDKIQSRMIVFSIHIEG
jgi:hypothetical protein